MRPITEPAGPGTDWLEQSRASLEERYRVAQRHSRLVRILKVALPIAGAIGFVAFVVIAYVMPELPEGVSVSAFNITDNAVVMENPRVSGYLDGGRSYELKADRAEQSLKNTKIVTLRNIAATIGLGQEGPAKVVAPEGTYNADEERLVLPQRIDVQTETLSGWLSSASIDFKAGTMSSSEPLQLATHDGSIRANSVAVSEGGKRIRFKNGVKVTFSMPAESSRAPASPVTE